MSLSFSPTLREYKKNLELVNAALDTMKLSEIEIKKIEDYIVTKQTFNKGELAHTYYDLGFDSIEILCTQNENENDLHIFQISIVAFPKEEDKTTQEFHALWSKEHPDRVIRQMIK